MRALRPQVRLFPVHHMVSLFMDGLGRRLWGGVGNWLIFRFFGNPYNWWKESSRNHPQKAFLRLRGTVYSHYTESPSMFNNREKDKTVFKKIGIYLKCLFNKLMPLKHTQTQWLYRQPHWHGFLLLPTSGSVAMWTANTKQDFGEVRSI